MANLENDVPDRTVPTRNSRMRGSLRRSRLAMTVAAGLAGGTLLSTCQTRVRDAFVSSSKDLFLSLLNPEVFLAALDTTDDPTANGE